MSSFLDYINAMDIQNNSKQSYISSYYWIRGKFILENEDFMDYFYKDFDKLMEGLKKMLDNPKISFGLSSYNNRLFILKHYLEFTRIHLINKFTEEIKKLDINNSDYMDKYNEYSDDFDIKMGKLASYSIILNKTANKNKNILKAKNMKPKAKPQLKKLIEVGSKQAKQKITKYFKQCVKLFKKQMKNGELPIRKLNNGNFGRHSWYKQLEDIIIFSLYFYAPPRRGQDYTMMRYIEIEKPEFNHAGLMVFKDSDKENWLVRSEEGFTLIFNRYKTKKNYGNQQFKQFLNGIDNPMYNSEFWSILEFWLSVRFSSNITKLEHHNKTITKDKLFYLKSNKISETLNYVSIKLFVSFQFSNLYPLSSM